LNWGRKNKSDMAPKGLIERSNGADGRKNLLLAGSKRTTRIGRWTQGIFGSQVNRLIPDEVLK